MTARDKREPGFWENLTPEQKVEEFNESAKNPGRYAAENFKDPDKTVEFQAPQSVTQPQGDTLPRRGRHRA